MIDKTLAFLVAELNTWFRSQQPAINNEDHVVLASMAPPGNGEPSPTENKVVVSLVNVQRESAAPVMAMRRADRSYAQRPPPLHLNVDVLVAVCFPNSYSRALAFLTGVLRFFQGRPSFTPDTSAAMPEDLSRLSVDLVDMSLSEVNNLWAVLGAPYMPAVVYRVRLLTIDEGRATAPTPAIGATGVGVTQ